MSNIFLARNFPPVLSNYNQLNEWPLQFLRTGDYLRSFGHPRGLTTNGYWWSGMVRSDSNGVDLGSWTGTVYAHVGNHRGHGFARRGVKNCIVYNVLRI